MSLASGAALGPYEILAPIGKGGMGEVYRARDTRLDRIVAIKVSHEEFTERFTREARSIAALNHANICHLYDVGPNYLVMEFVEGETLSGPVELDEAVRIVGQLIDGIEAAHDKNIIHRDLKPANIKMTPEGVVKILDFGLAKAADPEPGGDPQNSPTQTIGATQAGTILGTAAYMAPEQARGKTADRRSDIWSFGVVVYELLTGKRAFEGESVVETLGAVMKSQPDWTPVPARMGRLLQACLEKDSRKRLQAIGDARLLLEETPAAPAGLPVPSRSRFGIVPWAVAAAFIVVSVALGILLWRAARPVEQPLKPLVRLDVDLGRDVSLNSTLGQDAVLSPDGTRLVYASHTRLFTRRLDQPRPTELAGTEGAFAPFFSPDGQWVAFFSGGRLKKISVAGGAAITLCDSPFGRGGSWGEDGYIIAALYTAAGLSRIPSAGGMPTAVMELAQGESTQAWPQILPGGKAVLFTSNSATGAWDGANIEVISFADRRRKTLQRGGTHGRYLPSGHLVYVNRGTLFAVPFDLDRLEVRGTPTPVLEDVAYDGANGFAKIDFSQSGTVVYRGGGVGGGLFTVQWLDSMGKTQPLLAKPGAYIRPRLSPDGKRLALEVTDGSGTDVWIYDWQRDTMTRLTFGGGTNQGPVWSPDGRYIVFQGQAGMFWTRADGAGKPQRLTQSKSVQWPWSFNPDGTRLAFHEGDLGAGDLWTLPLESEGAGLRAKQPEVFLQTPFDERAPSFSPDGRWLAYASSESGTYQVYVRAFPDKGGKWQVSNSGGNYPEWSHNGGDLFFRTAEDYRIMVAAYTVKADSFVADKPRVWSEKRLANVGINRSYDVAPDGKRIAALMPSEGAEDQNASDHLIFLLNFFDELRRRSPVSKK